LKDAVAAATRMPCRRAAVTCPREPGRAGAPPRRHRL